MRIPKIWTEPIQGYDPWKNSNEFFFDAKAAKACCLRFEDFSHMKGQWAGKPFILEPHQRKIIGHTFGWKRKSDGTRRYREVMLYEPKKNGKTQLAAGVALILLHDDGEPGAEVYCASGDIAQADIIFSAATYMVENNSELKEDIRILPGYKTMKYLDTQSYWKVLSSEAKTKHGPNVHGLIIDELHIFRNDELIETLTAGTVSRLQPLTFYLTTADFAGPSVCNKMLDKARAIRDGKMDNPYFLPVIYETLPDTHDWKDPKVWEMVNPNYGISVQESYFRKLFAEAQEDSSKENTFKRLHLNMQTEQERRWLKMEDWDSSGCILDKTDLLGQECFGGLDLSSSQDITAFVLYFPKHCACIPFFWVPERTASKRIEYEMWAREGYANITTGKVVNYEVVRADINETRGLYDIKDIGYDPWNASQISKQLADDDGLPMMEYRQGYKSMNEPSKEVEKLVIQRKLAHFGNPVLRWMASNVQVAEDPAGNIKPTKAQKDSPKKIDGIVALVMAVGLSMTVKVEDKPFQGGLSFI